MILITGGAGYIGSHTVLNLIEKTDYKIIIFDNLENGHIETVNTLLEINSDRIIFEKGDLRNIEDIENVFNKYAEIDGVIHFAAFALVEESVQNPSKYYRNNIYGTLNLLDTMIKHNVKRIVFSSTCATYGEPTYTPIDEKHPQNPINPYGYSKLAVERIMDDYDKAYKLKSIRLRYFNVAGADEKGRIGEWHEPETHLIPNILKANYNKVFTIFGNDYDTRDGTCIRDYVNVLDLAEAHRLSYEYLIKENKTDVFNIGTGEGYSVKEVFETCERVLNKKIPVEIKGRRAGDPAVLYADIGKVENILNWKSEKSLEDSIKSGYLFEELNHKNDFCILVAYHKKSTLVKNNCLVPIQVGKTLSPYILDNMIGDNLGDNISYKNYNYAELTAIYWNWKNVKSEYKGLMHYRRFLDLNDNSEHKHKDYYEIVIDDNFDCTNFLNKLKINKYRIKEILENNLIITRKKEDLRSWGKYTIRQHYYAEHIGKHLDMALDIIKNDYPEYYDNAIELIDGYSSYFGNMVIMKSKDFDDYCNFLFDITSKIDNQINLYDSILQQYSVHARYNGFLGERLTAIYINQKIKEGYNVAEFPAVVLTTDKNKKWHEYNTYDTTKYNNNENIEITYLKNNEDITKPKITVAIAAYNVEQYISQAIQSVINQTLKNIEIIIINDGSTDVTKDIIQKYASMDDRIKIINKYNGGLGSVRNLSIEKAEGEYIHFMDGDDYMDADFLQSLVKNADSNNSEMVVSLHRIVNENGNFLYNSTLPYTLYGANLNIFNTADIMLMPCHVWDKIFKTKFLKNSKVYFPDRGTGEDIVFMYKILLKLDNISILRDIKYNYRFNENSTQSKSDTVLNGINNILITKKYIQETNNYLITEYFQLFIYIIINHIIFRAKKLFKDKDFSIEFYNKSKELFKEKVVISKRIEILKAYFNCVDYNLLENMYKQNNYHQWRKFLNKIIGYTSLIENIFSIKKNNKYIIIRLLGIKITIKNR